MGRFSKNLGILLVVLFLLVLAACSSSNISLDRFELNAAGGVDELAIGKTLALTVVIEETDPEDQGQATVEWSINSLATTAINVTEAELANETGRENTLTAKAEGKVEIVVKSEGEERKLEIDIIRDDDGDGFPAGEQDPDDNDPCNPDDTVQACTDTIDNDGDGTSKTTDPNDEDPCDPNDTIQACTDTIDNDGDGTSKTTDPNDEDPCDPDDTVQACTDSKVDNDGDGVPASTDPDDNDPCNPDDTVQACIDSLDGDGDGTPKATDPDDNDPCNPSDEVPACDFDGDGSPDGLDDDDDNDGTKDVDDAFPKDPSEDTDTDGDGIGNNADTDDDGDGTPDDEDAFPLDPNEDTDTDGDGIGNNADTDDDGDGATDQDEIDAGTDPLDPNDTPIIFAMEPTSCNTAVNVEDRCTIMVEFIGSTTEFNGFEFTVMFENSNFELVVQSATSPITGWIANNSASKVSATGPTANAPIKIVTFTIERVGPGSDTATLDNVTINGDPVDIVKSTLNLPEGTQGLEPKFALNNSDNDSCEDATEVNDTCTIVVVAEDISGTKEGFDFDLAFSNGGIFEVLPLTATTISGWTGANSAVRGSAFGPGTALSGEVFTFRVMRIADGNDTLTLDNVGTEPNGNAPEGSSLGL